MKSFIFNLLCGKLGSIVGYQNLVRIGAFFMRAGRQDMRNDIATNGEILVQKVILNSAKNAEIIVIDCGANTGQWSAQLVSTARSLNVKSCLKVFCFEPSLYTFKNLSAALKDLQSETVNLTAIQKALSSDTGHISLKIVHDGAGTNSIVGVPGGYMSEELVAVTTVQEFSAVNNLEYIDFLKIDAEGHDFDVMLGAKKLLEDQHIGVVQFEYNWRWIYGKHFLKEAFDFFELYGYSIGKITPKGIQFYQCYNVQLESFVEGNYIACTERYKSLFKQAPSWLN